MIALRIMLPEGEGEFRNYINQLRSSPSTQRPDLNDPPYSREFSPRVMLDESPAFGSKMEMAEYLDRAFTQAGLKREDLAGEKDLWTYIAYLWFDRLAPLDGLTGKRQIGETAKYICSSDYRDYYRHFVAGPFNIHSLHKDNSRVFLYSPVYEHNDFIEQIASRQFIISHQNLIEAFSMLYFDRASEKPKKRAQSRQRAGNIRRFVKIIQQFELTYDIYSMSPRQIINLLPQEFSEWRR